MPPVGRVDTATVLVLLVLQYLIVLLLLAISSRLADPLTVLMTSVLELAIHSLYLFFFAILISIILSWVAPHAYNPVIGMVNAMAAPVLRPFRRIVPPIGGLDISPIFAIILLQAVVILLQSIQPIRV
ncbi:MAG: YggT family protein [Woeseiaceae bacterium]|nr:YggT family protein [Woeseiaceae bacterium]